MHQSAPSRQQGGNKNNRLIQCALINARSLCNKLPDLHFLLYDRNEFDVIVITVSWLNPEISNGLLDPRSTYTVYRRDRQNNTGGGVCAFLKNSLHTEQLDISSLPANVELLCFDLICNSYKHRLFAVYRPTNSSCVYNDISQEEYIKQVTDFIQTNTNDKGPTLIVGDLNSPDINWIGRSAPQCQTQNILYEFCSTQSYTQCILEPTRGGNILDLVLTNDEFMLSSARVTAPFSSSDHNTVC
jgi:hypothetical protein